MEGKILLLESSNVGISIQGEAFKDAKILCNEQLDFLDKDRLARQMCLSLDSESIEACVCLIDFMDKVINTPGEDELDKMKLINYIATATVADYCKQRKIPVVYLSTYEVFDGKKEDAYCETDEVCPISEYGKTKAIAEEAILNANSQNVVIRLPWLYGISFDYNDVAQFIKHMLKEEAITVMDDHVGNLCNIFDLGKIIRTVVNIVSNDPNSMGGVYHLSAKGFASRFDICSEIMRNSKKIFGDAIKTAEIIPSTDEEEGILGQKNCCLSSRKFLDTFRINLPDWKFSLFNATQKIIKKEIYG